MDLIRKLIHFTMDILETMVFVFSLFIVLYLFILQPHEVRGASMDNTFKDSDYILTSKIAYRFENPQRGDVIVFKSPKNPDVDYIKRIIGLPNDRLVIKGGKVDINDKALQESYTTTPTTVSVGGFLSEGEEVIVPPGYLFVMGDNRARSSDSREFGFIPQTAVIGKVFFRYLPPQKIGPIKNPYLSLLDSASKNRVVLAGSPFIFISTRP